MTYCDNICIQPCVAAGMLVDASNNIQINGGLRPTHQADLGSNNKRWGDLYMSGTTIDLAGTIIEKREDGGVKIEDRYTIQTLNTYTSEATTLQDYGGRTPFYDAPNETLNVPEGWEQIEFDDSDEGYVTIPDIGFDMYVYGTNIRNKIQVFSKRYIKLDGLGNANSGNMPIYYPDEDTPAALSIHYGSFDQMTYYVFYKTIIENGVRGIVIRHESKEYNVTDVTTYPIEVTLFESNKIRISLFNNVPYYFRAIGNFGVSNGQKWVYRMTSIPEENTSYIWTPKTVVQSSEQTSIGIYTSPDKLEIVRKTSPSMVVVVTDFGENFDETIKDVSDSKFKNVTTTNQLDFLFDNTDVIFLISSNTITNTNNIYNLVANGSILYVQKTGFTSQLNSIFNICHSLNSFTPQNQSNPLTTISDVCENAIIKSSPLIYYYDGYSVPLSDISGDVTILARRPGTDEAVLFMKQVGSGYVIVDLIDNGGLSYRINVFNDLYDYVLNTQTIYTLFETQENKTVNVNGKLQVVDTLQTTTNLQQVEKNLLNVITPTLEVTKIAGSGFLGGVINTPPSPSTFSPGNDVLSIYIDNTVQPIYGIDSNALFNNDLTIDTYIYYPEAVPNALNDLPFTIGTLDFGGTNYAWGFGMNNEGYLVFAYIDDSSTTTTIKTTATLSLNTWYHIAVTFDSSSNLLRLYINGTVQSIDASGNTSYLISSTPRLIGYPIVTGYYNGVPQKAYLADLRIIQSLVTPVFNPTGPQSTDISNAVIFLRTIASGNDIQFTINNSGNVGIGTAIPQTKLHINDTGAVILPHGTTAQRPANPISGMVRVNTETSSLEFYDGSSWISLT